MEHLDALRLAVGLGVMGVASAMDLRTRRVPNRVWAVGGAAALMILAADLTEQGVPLLAFLAFIPIAVLAFDALWDRPAITSEESGRTTAVVLGLYGVAGLSFGLLTWTWLQGGLTPEEYFPLISIIGMILVAYGLYAVGLLRGGADAKAIMMIAVLVPHYPVVGVLPLLRLDALVAGSVELIFPFALVSLMNAALLSLFIPVYYLARNAAKGNLRFPLALFGLKVSIKDVPTFSWLMEHVVDGEVETRLMPRGKVDMEEELAKLSEAGRESVWVTPQIPFIVLILLGFLVSFAVGNLFFVVLGAAS